MKKILIYSLLIVLALSSCKLKRAAIKASRQLSKTNIITSANNVNYIYLKDKSKITFDYSTTPDIASFDVYSKTININGLKIDKKNIAYIKSPTSIKTMKKLKKLFKADYELRSNNSKLHIYSQLLTASNGRDYERAVYYKYHDFLVLDPKTGNIGSIEDYNFIAPLVRDNPKCTQYLRQYKRKRVARYIHSVASIGAIIGAFVVDKSEKIEKDKGDVLSIQLGGAGVFNLILGGIYRKKNNSFPLILAVEEYNKPD